MREGLSEPWSEPTLVKFCPAAMALQQKLPPSDWGLRPTSSAEKRIVSMVFRRHYDQLAGGVVNPDRLTTLLYAKGLISTGTRDEVLTTQGLPRTQKVVKILNAVEAMLLTHHKPAVALKEFCRAVKNQPALKPVAKDIRSELGEWKFTDKPNTTGADPEIEEGRRGGGGAARRSLCAYTAQRSRGWGHFPPRKFLTFRPCF